MATSATLKNPDKFDNYHLYFRNHDTANYNELVKRTNRKPNIIYPKGYYDFDIDRVIAGSYCVHHGIQELKHADNLNNDFEWNFDQRGKIDSILNSSTSKFQIEYFTLNFTKHGNKGVKSPNLNVVSTGKYSDLLKGLKQTKFANEEQGKGIFLYIFYTDNMEYFCPINFTGSDLIFGEGSGITKTKFDYLISELGKRIEPCFNEFLLFLVESYIRQNFEKLSDHLANGVKNGLIKHQFDWEKNISMDYSNRKNKVCAWHAFSSVMEWILECIHVDTILDQKFGQGYSTQYPDFVDLVRSGKIETEIINRLNEEYSNCMATYKTSV